MHQKQPPAKMAVSGDLSARTEVVKRLNSSNKDSFMVVSLMYKDSDRTTVACVSFRLMFDVKLL